MKRQDEMLLKTHAGARDAEPDAAQMDRFRQPSSRPPRHRWRSEVDDRRHRELRRRTAVVRLLSGRNSLQRALPSDRGPSSRLRLPAAITSAADRQHRRWTGSHPRRSRHLSGARRCLAGRLLAAFALLVFLVFPLQGLSGRFRRESAPRCNRSTARPISSPTQAIVSSPPATS